MANGFQISERAFDYPESPSEDCRALQQKGLKADGGGTFQSSWHSYHPSLSAVTAFLQKTERNGEKPVSPLPP